MSSPPKPLDNPVDDNLQAGAEEPWAGSSVDKQPSSPPANPSSKPEQPLTPHESTSPTLPKSQPDDADTSSSLSAAPSPLTTHRPTSSKTSIDDQPLTPLDSPDKHPQSAKEQPESVQETPKGPEQDAEDKAEAQPIKQPSSAPVEKPVETPKIALPEDKVGTILQLNAELLNVYNEFHTRDQVAALHNELQQYSLRIQTNVQWLMQYKETLGTQFASRIPLAVLSPPPPVPFMSTESVNALYAHLSSLFEKENARALRKQQLRQMMMAGNAPMMTGVTASDPINVNVNGKRERAEDEQQSSLESVGDQSPRKRIDTGESKAMAGMPLNTNTPSPASMHAGSPSRMNASPSHTHATTNPNPPPGALGGPLRPSSSQSNSSGTAQVPMAPPSTFPGGGGMNGPQGMIGPQQLERMRMVQQQNRIRAMAGGGAGSNGSPQTMINGSGAQQNQNQPSSQQGQNQNQHGNAAALLAQLGITPRSVPATILPQLLAMIRNPQMHQSVQLLHSKIPDFGKLPPDQQASVLWAFQQNQMRQQQEMQHRQQLNQQHQMQQVQQQQQQQHNMQGQVQGGQMPGQMQQQQQGVQNGGYPQSGGMGMGGMRPTSAGSMQPPPSPHSIQQQRQLNLMQQQQAALGRAPPPGMAGGYPGGGGMNPGMGMGVGGMGGMGGMGLGGHARMPSNPTMGPPPVPLSASSTPQSMYSSASQGMNQYQPGAINPMNLSYPMQPHQSQQQQSHQPQQQQQQHYGMHHQSPSMAGSPPNSTGSATWSPMDGGGGGGGNGGQGQALTPAAIMQQQQAKMGGMSPAPGSMDPNVIVNWTDLTAT